MKEKPIPFSANMIRAILEGRKVMTRRIINPQPLHVVSYRMGDGLMNPHNSKPIYCPYGHAGNRLWVREAWRAAARFDKNPPRDIPADSAVFYEADKSMRACGPFGKYRHARFMPRWASRILLEITDVRVERLKSMSEKDCIAEGMNRNDPRSYRDEFHDLWDSINGPGSWDANPWVWVVCFKVLK